MDYYSNIASFVSDEEFFKLMDAIWKIPKRTKVFANTLGSFAEAKIAENKKLNNKVSPTVAVRSAPPTSTTPPPNVSNIVAALKAQLAKRGARGISGISRKFKIMDDDDSKSLSKDEFTKAMRECDIGLTGTELNILFNYFDTGNDGSINLEEFIQGIRDPMNKQRLSIVHQAFDVIDADGNGIVEVSEVINRYNATKHPDVIAGKKSANDIMKEVGERSERAFW